MTLLSLTFRAHPVRHILASRTAPSLTRRLQSPARLTTNSSDGEFVSQRR